MYCTVRATLDEQIRKERRTLAAVCTITVASEAELRRLRSSFLQTARRITTEKPEDRVWEGKYGMWGGYVGAR